VKSVKFKDSPLGPIPQDWEVKRLGDLCEKIGSGATPLGGASSYCQTGIALIRSQNVVDTRFSFDGLAYINSDQADELANVEVLSKDVLLNITGDSVARVCTVPDSALPARVNQHVCILRTIAKKCHYLYLAYRLVVEKKRLLAAAFGGGTRNALTKADVEAFTIPCPPLPEQQRIAEALGGVDKLIESLDEQIEKKHLIAKGVAHDLLSGKKRLPGFKGEWRCANLGTLVDFITDTIATKDIDTRKYVSTDNMLSNLAGVTPNKSIVPYASVREFKSGDILLSNIRPYLKKMWFADYDAGCSTDVLVLRVVADVIDSRFLYRVLARDTFFEFVSAKAVGTKMPRGDKRVIAVFQVPIPQLAEQQAIADLLGEQDAAIAALEAKREKYVRIKEGMMRDLLTGKVRMKGECDDK
jgi:type I restriction enzyme S subunit